MKQSELLRRFEAHDVEAATFDHEQHVRVAFEMLARYGFLEASTRYIAAIQAIATEAGVPEKFNMTITLAFLALIAERASRSVDCDFDEFIAWNPDLLSRTVLDRWYSAERLQSDLARRQFLLPGKVA